MSAPIGTNPLALSMSDRCAQVQTKLYGLIRHEKLSDGVMEVLLDCHRQLGDVVYDGMSKTKSEDRVSPLPVFPLVSKVTEDIIENIILRRVNQNKVTGYTLEMAKEIAKALSSYMRDAAQDVASAMVGSPVRATTSKAGNPEVSRLLCDALSKGDVMVAVDLSGGMEREDIVAIYALLDAIQKGRKDKHLLIVVTFDTKIRDMWVLKAGMLMPPMPEYGGGGSDILPVLAQAMNIELKMLMVFTDGLFELPIHPIAANVPVKWVLIGADSPPMAWGTTIPFRFVSHRKSGG